MTIPFDKNKNIPLKEYLKILGDELKVDHKYLYGYIANMYTSFDFVDENKSIVDVRKSAKRS